MEEFARALSSLCNVHQNALQYTVGDLRNRLATVRVKLRGILARENMVQGEKSFASFSVSGQTKPALFSSSP